MKRSCPQRARTAFSACFALGLSMAALGILGAERVQAADASSPGARFKGVAKGLAAGSSSGSIGEALLCLEGQAARSSFRARLLAAADSLGDLMEAGGEPSKELLRQAERIKSEALKGEIEFLVEQDRCRGLAERGLAECETRLSDLQPRVATGKADSSAAQELLWLQHARAELQASLASPAIFQYPLLPPQSGETQETLREKLQFYRDVEDYLARLDQRVFDRLKQVREEARALAEARRFLGDLSFIDEGGLISAEGSVRLRGAVPGGGGDGGMNRPASDLPWDGQGADLEFALRLTPTSAEESDRLIVLLEGYRREIQRELERIEEQTGTIEDRLVPETAPAR